MPKSVARLSRRRFLHISAAMPGLALLPVAAGAAPADAKLEIWRGVALGADSTIQISHADPAEAQRLIGLCVQEIHRLEAIFSLYQDDSAIRRLNRLGALADPPVELVEVLGMSEGFNRLTGGAFDVSVQPLWELYEAHFSAPAPDPNGPPEARIRDALSRVGHAGLAVDPRRIGFARPGMGITLNGIAQGYATDRVVALLRREGVERSLVDLGELRAIGSRPGGGPWVVGIEDPARPGWSARRIELENRAVSTSGGYGTPFDTAGRFNHIFDPASGHTSFRYRSVSVVADASATADAISTAFCLMPPEATAPIVRSLGLRAYFALDGGGWLVQGA